MFQGGYNTKVKKLLSKVSLLCLGGALSFTIAAQPITENAQRQIAALLAEKASRNPAQQKMDSHLVHAAAILSGRPVHPDFPTPPGELEAVHLDRRNYVEVDISAEVTPSLLSYVASLGGAVINSFPEYRSLRAQLPLLSVEQLAAREEVHQIRTADYGHGNGARHPKPTRTSLGRLRQALRSAFFVGSDNNGDVAHQANTERATLGFDGTGVKIGILSGGVSSLANEQQAGRLPPVNVIPGQAGSGDEGTAMLEIVYTLAPGATLYFATALGGQAPLAANIQALANAGCRIIIDDWTYFAEGVFEDGTVARVVESVAASGVFYFSDVQNSGSVLYGNSGTWEGDFLDSGTTISTIPSLQASGSAIHNFGTNSNVVYYDSLTRLTEDDSSFTGDYELKWSDPLGGSSNDYDLFILNPGMTTVLGSSTNVQNGSQDPEEHINADNSFPAGAQIVILKHPSAAVRALHLDTERGVLAIGTTGATFGHNAAAGAFTMAAIDVQEARGGAFTGGSANPTYFYNSDGPRRIFFNGDGSAITPGNFLFATNAGAVLNKPDFTAADGVTTGVTGYTTFYGSSAAGPHAGAIAALVLQAMPAITVAQMRAALTASALAVDGPAPNIDGGTGIVMAPGAVTAALNSGVTITVQHTGNFIQGQSAAGFTVVVSNAGAANPSTGAITVTEILPAGLALTSLSGSGWTCSGTSCTRSDRLPAGASFPAIGVVVSVASNAASLLANQVRLSISGVVIASASDLAIIVPPAPTIFSGGVVTLDSTSSTIQPGSWASIFGTSLAGAAATWKGDYPVSLGGVSVTVNGRSAYLSYVGPAQINLQTPDDTARGPVRVVVTTPGGSVTSTATLADVSPSLNLFDSKHVAGVILTPGGTGAYAGGTYDLVGPTGAFSFQTRPVKAGEVLLLYGTGFGPTTPVVAAGVPFTGVAPTTDAVKVTLGGVSVTPISSVAYASGAYQIALTVPSLPSGDQPVAITVASAQTPSSIVVTVQ
jgi:uncharacterized protein (TIGR03437 family)